MSVAIARPMPLPAYPLSGLDESDQERVDWGTATPVNGHAEIELEDDFTYLVSKRGVKRKVVPDVGETQPVLPSSQKALLLKGLRQPFDLTDSHRVPSISASDETIIRIQAIGLNPIDWKSVDYGFGIPVLPYVSGRDFAGTVVKAPAAKSHLQVGDTILCPSTDYRDLRKAAYQEFAVATDSTVCRLPDHVSVSQGAALGVAYVAAALALGVCIGLRMPNLGPHKGPDLLSIVRSTPLGALPRGTSIIQECLAIKDESDRPRIKDWLVIWGGSSTSALFLSQIARLAGMKVVLVVDVAKHGSRLMDTSGCVCVDSHDSARAVEVIRGVTGGALRFAIDTVGKQTAEHLARCLQVESAEDTKQAHLVGLAALPSARLPGVVYHSVPVKLFHEVPAVGRAMMRWLEGALQTSTLELPRVDEAPGGLGGINDALNLMRQGQISGKRLVVPL